MRHVRYLNSLNNGAYDRFELYVTTRELRDSVRVSCQAFGIQGLLYLLGSPTLTHLISGVDVKITGYCSKLDELKSTFLDQTVLETEIPIMRSWVMLAKLVSNFACLHVLALTFLDCSRGH